MTKIVPIITERTVKTGLNMERLEKIMREACEQSGRSVLPSLSLVFDFNDALLDGKNSEERIIFHPSDDLYKPDKKAETVSIFVGPEGGFSDSEVVQAQTLGYKVVSLGSLILRGETAAIIGTYRAVHGV